MEPTVTTSYPVPKGYRPLLTVRETEQAIKQVKDFFEAALALKLNLERISAPLFVRPETGLNDNLNGVERPVSFGLKSLNEANCEIVQSLAKWKRMALGKYGFAPGEGLYTDMNAIRRDEDLDNMHSIYVDQWDWEKVIRREDRRLETLQDVVRHIYKACRETEIDIHGDFPALGQPLLPAEIYFITTGELEERWPQVTPKEREDLICKEKGAVCVMQIGGLLKSGIKHDGRAPDYDDWQLNADIVLWNPLLGRAFEISSMGIRVGPEELLAQLKEAGCEERLQTPFHSELAAGKLPYSIGGGIGQSRLCMFFLRKAHVGEVQASVWPEAMIAECRAAGVELL